MTRNPLFSTYRQGENRVTASMLAVFERIDAGVVERLLAAASGDSSVTFVTFANQVVGERGSIPDASISASFKYLFEVKTSRSALGLDQLARHLRNLKGSYADERLFFITPDVQSPAVVAQLGDRRVVWLNFLTINQAIDDLLGDPVEHVSEQTRFLLRELQALFAHDGLLEPEEDVVVVAARRAWPEYLAHAAYMCQAGRSFRVGLSRMAFYAEGAIQPQLPRILAHRDNVEMTREAAKALLASNDPEEAEFGRLLERVFDEGTRPEGPPEQIFLLSPPDDERTMVLPHPVRNTNLDRNGRPTTWVQGQRYTRSDVLATGPATTDELEQRGG